VPIWGFIFVLAAAIAFAVVAVYSKALLAAALCLLSVGLIFTFATSTSPVHF
jgi:hypothetical protein